MSVTNSTKMVLGGGVVVGGTWWRNTVSSFESTIKFFNGINYEKVPDLHM